MIKQPSKLAYLTRVDVSSQAAQAKQILCMARAFADELGTDFILTSSGHPPFTNLFQHKSLAFAGSKFSRYFSICLNTAALMIRKHDTVVFTRDIAVAFIAVVLGGAALYEAHKEPKSWIAVQLVHLLSRSARFHLVVISAALADYYRMHYSLSNDKLLIAHDGVFSEERYIQLLRLNNFTPLTYELDQSKLMLLDQIKRNLNNSAFLSTAQIEQLNDLSSQQREVSLLVLNTEKYKDQIALFFY